MPAPADDTVRPPPRTRAPGPASSPSTPGGRRGRRPTLLRLAVVALLVAVGAVALLATRPDGAGPGDTAAGTPSTGSKPTTSADSKGGDPTGGTDTPSSDTPGSGSAGSGAAAQEQFVRDYYRAAPGGSDEAWAMLGPGEQQQGRAAYDGFWSTIESVEVREATANADDDTVLVTLVYRTTKGTTSTERKREQLTVTDDGFLLESDEPAS